tara:strand:+ start:67 stop:510 length:444 start_codon:yes stop_codon:yes gene_type:complete
VEKENNNRKEPAYSMKLRAGRKRTYFFDVRPTRSEDYYLTITESKRKFDGEGYERHKIFVYKEDLNKFIEALNNTVDHIKTDLMPDYDFDSFHREDDIINITNSNYSNSNTETVDNSNIADTESNNETDITSNEEVVSEIDEEELKW